jgi:hypothetical protein
MSTTLRAPAIADTHSATMSAAPRGTRFRRRLAAFSFAADSSVRSCLESYAAAPEKVMVSATLLHYGYLLMVPAVFAMAGIARRAAPRLANATHSSSACWRRG